MKNHNSKNRIKTFFLISTFFLSTFLTLSTFKKINYDDIHVSGSKLIFREDIVNNSSLNVSSRLIFIKTKLIEKELKKNLSLENISISRQILPFGLKILVKTRQPVAYGERFLNGEIQSGYIDENGFFINSKYTETDKLEELTLTVYGWDYSSRKTIVKILDFIKTNNLELISISFSRSGFLTLQEKELKIILLGFNQNLVKKQLQIITNIKSQLKKDQILKKIHTVDLTDPNSPKIKVFKP